jgi:hypothetical protein
MKPKPIRAKMNNEPAVEMTGRFNESLAILNECLPNKK